MIYDVIHSLLALTEKLTCFNKQLLGFIISLKLKNEFYFQYTDYSMHPYPLRHSALKVS